MAASVEQRFWVKVNKSSDNPKGCWLWTAGTQSKGYGCFGKKLAHRFSYEMEHGSVPPGLKVLHKCDTPRCVRPDHLFAGTHKDNMDDMVAKQRAASGERNCNSRPAIRVRKSQLSKRGTILDVDKVRSIKLKLAEDVPPSQLACEHSVSVDCILSIRNGRTWRHVSA